MRGHSQVQHATGGEGSRLALALLMVALAPLAAREPSVVGEVEADFKSLKSQVPYSTESVGRGGVLFQRFCTQCHGRDGKAQIDVIADATDLTQPSLWYSGTSEGEIFRSIRDGAGVAMPPFRDHLATEHDIWDVVNYVRSLWPESMRPKLESGSASQQKSEQQSVEPALEGGDHEQPR